MAMSLLWLGTDFFCVTVAFLIEATLSAGVVGHFLTLRYNKHFRKCFGQILPTISWSIPAHLSQQGIHNFGVVSRFFGNFVTHVLHTHTHNIAEIVCHMFAEKITQQRLTSRLLPASNGLRQRDHEYLIRCFKYSTAPQAVSSTTKMYKINTTVRHRKGNN